MMARYHVVVHGRLSLEASDEEQAETQVNELLGSVPLDLEVVVRCVPED